MTTLGNAHPTQYDEINALLAEVIGGARAILGEDLIGFYLHGSLASGDFSLYRSDIDFIALTTGPLNNEQIAALAAMHAKIYDSGMPWAENLEGSYIPRDALRRRDPDNSAFPALRVDGSFDVDDHGADWIIQRWVLREHGVVVFGPPLHDLIDPISPDDLRESAEDTLQAWWAPKLTDPSYLYDAEYQVYAVLTMCRALYTLEWGEVTSKPAAARWAQMGPAARWRGLIASALAWERGEPFERLNEVLGFIRFVVEGEES
jgi:hypothetical protein